MMRIYVDNFLFYKSRRIISYKNILVRSNIFVVYVVVRSNQNGAMRRTGASSKVKVLCECRRPPRCVFLYLEYLQ